MEIICSLLLAVIVAFITLPILRDQNKELKLQLSPDAASNYNIKGDFCYRIHMDPRSVHNVLAGRSAGGNLDFYYDPAGSTITFRYFDRKVKYQLCFLDADGQHFLHLKKVYVLGSGIFIHLINDFWRDEISAEPLPYHEFEEICKKK